MLPSCGAGYDAGLSRLGACRRRMGDAAAACRKGEPRNLRRLPSAHTIARLMTIGRTGLSKSETVLVAAFEKGAPALVEARDIVDEFHDMLRRKAVDAFTPWVERAKQSLVASFANSVIRDDVAVRAAIASPWSNGQTEGQITKLKLVKRQMYGRAKIDLLQARLIGAN